MELGGQWRVTPSTEELRRQMADPSLDDRGWSQHPVPGHWRSHPDLAQEDGPVLYRRRFESQKPAPGQRAFLVFDGIFYQGDVWLDGDYVGDTEGYFFPHTFEVTDALSRADEHLLAVEVGCARPTDLKAKRNLTGVFQHWDCMDPAWNPGGIWRPVRIERSGPVRITSCKVLCREANTERAVLDFEAELDSGDATEVTLTTTVERETGDNEPVLDRQEQVLSAGPTVVRWRVFVNRPALWWPRALGGQPLYRCAVEVARPDESTSDRQEFLTGLRQFRMRNFLATVNGERLFLKGANLGPTKRALGEATPEELEADITAAADAGLDLVRVHAHVSRPELYEAADRQGMLVWQDMPLQWGYGNVRRQAVRQARRLVHFLGHHPSVAIWCGHNEPMAVQAPPGLSQDARTVARVAAGQLLPTWNKSGLDRSIRRALERADHSRPVVPHSGVLPHPMGGTDSHFYYGWYKGDEREFPAALSRLPVMARFVSQFGAQAVPDSDRFMQPERWPDLDWEHLTEHHCLQKEIFDRRIPPGRFDTFDAWKRATQQYQAQVLRHQIETLRRLKYRPTGGFCMYLLADSQEAVSWSVLDHNRAPKAGYQAVKEACRPVIVVADRMPASYQAGDRIRLAVHAISDLRATIDRAVVEAELRWPGGQRRWRFEGDIEADHCHRVGRLDLSLPKQSPPGLIELDLSLSWAGGRATNSYSSWVAV